MVENSAIVYSKQPRQSYSVLHDGKMKGLGVMPIFDVVPGAWNILWLSAASTIEALLNWHEDPGAFPPHCGALPVAVGTALQMAPGDHKYFTTYGDLAMTLPPHKLITLMRSAEDKPLIVRLYPTWYDIAEENAKLYIPRRENVIAVDFRSARLQ